MNWIYILFATCIPLFIIIVVDFVISSDIHTSKLCAMCMVAEIWIHAFFVIGLCEMNFPSVSAHERQHILLYTYCLDVGQMEEKLVVKFSVLFLTNALPLKCMLSTDSTSHSQESITIDHIKLFRKINSKKMSASSRSGRELH